MLKTYTRNTPKEVVSITLNLKDNKLVVDKPRVVIKAGKSEILWESQNAMISIQFPQSTPFLTKVFICSSGAGCLSGVPRKGSVSPGTYDYFVEFKYPVLNLKNPKAITTKVLRTKLQVVVE